MCAESTGMSSVRNAASARISRMDSSTLCKAATCAHLDEMPRIAWRPLKRRHGLLRNDEFPGLLFTAPARFKPMRHSEVLAFLPVSEPPFTVVQTWRGRIKSLAEVGLRPSALCRILLSRARSLQPLFINEQ